MKTGYFQLLTVCGAVAVLLPVASRAADDKVPVVTNQEAPQAPLEQKADDQKTQLSPGLDDIVKLTKSKIEESVIVSFVKSSEVPYQPTAQEVIQLRETGVSAAVIDAMLQRGEELRRRAAEAHKAQFSATASQQSPQVATPPEPIPVVDTNVSPSVVYVPGTTYAYYPYWPYYGCGSCGYPCYYYGGCYPSFSIGFAFGFGYGCYPYGYYGGCYPYYYHCGGYYYGGCHGGSYHVGPNGTHTSAKSGYVSTSGNVTKNGGVNRGGYQTGYSGAKQSVYRGGTAGSTGGSAAAYKNGYSGGGYTGGGYSGGSYTDPTGGGKSGYQGGGSYGGNRGGSQSASSYGGGYQSGYSGGARGGYVGGGARGGFSGGGGGGYRGK